MSVSVSRGSSLSVMTLLGVSHIMSSLQRASLLIKQSRLCVRCFHSSSALSKNRRAGQPKSTLNKTLPLTYEQAKPPHHIGVSKSWNSWNTSSLFEEGRSKDTVMEDVFIRKFMTGTWPNLFLSEVIIKRQHNIIIIAGLILQGIAPRKMYFLWGYTEEMLSILLKCPVKLEIQTVQNRKDVIFKYI